MGECPFQSFELQDLFAPIPCGFACHPATVSKNGPMNVPGLRSPYEKVGGIFYFGRMLDKIRLHAAGKLPEEYRNNLGTGFDGRAAGFLQIEYPALVERVKGGGND